jgi:hypothetical protein
MRENGEAEKELMSEEEIDENLDESFPASDPPSWSLGTDHGREKSQAEATDDNSEE